MEITGKIIHILEPRSGVSQATGNPWMSQSFVLETEEQYPRRCVFDVFGEDKLREFNIQPGQRYTVSINIDAREYQGRWFNSIRAWRVAIPADTAVYGAAPTAQGAAVDYSQAPYGPQVSPAVPAPAPVAAPADSSDDLPF